MTIREEPPTTPACPRCGATTAEHDEDARAISGRGWYCPKPCDTFYAGTAAEAATHAARTAREQQARSEMAVAPPVLRVIRGES